MLRLAAAFLIALTGSLSPAAAPTPSPATIKASVPEITTAAINIYAQGVRLSYRNTVRAVDDMRHTIDVFLDAPTTAHLTLCRAAWVRAHGIYCLTEPYRFYKGPIDNPRNELEGKINAWPLDEAYIDYVRDNPKAGIINMPEQYPTIDEDLLVSMNEREGEKNISTGFHAVEFLLWGQDFNPDGPGDRPASDYTAGTSSSNDRRRHYLKETAALLSRHLMQVETEWELNPGTYGTEFIALDPRRALRHIITGVAMMAGHEMSRERMFVALDTKDQENEDSCFSDTTVFAFQQNIEGIRRIYVGNYGDVKGPGLGEVFAQSNPQLERRILLSLLAAVSAVNAIPSPFDQAMRDENARRKIETAVATLDDFTSLLVEAAAEMRIKIDMD